ncbi:MAG: glycine cleavage system protein GcvH [Anaerolineae bacterium]
MSEKDPYPEDLRYTEEHEWARWQDGEALVGITHYAQDQLGDVVYVELPAPGDAVQQSEPFGVVESVKAASDLYSPLSGRVSALNEALAERPELVNEDPYGEGWMIRLEPSDAAELEGLLSAAAYRAWVEGTE